MKTVDNIQKTDIMNSYLFKGEFVMIERRNIAVCIVLTLVTCGIYGIYWIVCLTNDVNTVSGDVNGTSGGMVVLLTIVTCQPEEHRSVLPTGLLLAASLFALSFPLLPAEFTAFTGHISRERSLTLQRITVESRQATAVFCI